MFRTLVIAFCIVVAFQAYVDAGAAAQEKAAARKEVRQEKKDALKTARQGAQAERQAIRAAGGSASDINAVNTAVHEVKHAIRTDAHEQIDIINAGGMVSGDPMIDFSMPPPTGSDAPPPPTGSDAPPPPPTGSDAPPPPTGSSPSPLAVNQPPPSSPPPPAYNYTTPKPSGR